MILISPPAANDSKAQPLKNKMGMGGADNEGEELTLQVIVDGN